MVALFRHGRALCVGIALLVAASASLAGEVQLSWNASQGASGYRVYWGPGSGQYTSSSDVGNTFVAPIDGLADCATSYFAVTAYNVSGESDYSGEVASWPRAVPASATPTLVDPGGPVVVTVSGVNFRNTDTIQLSHPGVAIDAAAVTCQQLVLNLSVAADATPGPVDVTVTHSNGVAGTGVALFGVNEPPADETPPGITGVDAIDIDGTSAVVVWSTDEPADGKVMIRKLGLTTYRTVESAALVTDHAVAVGGLEPETTYAYHVASSDEAGNTTTTSPDETFTTGVSPFAYIRVEPELASLDGEVRATSGEGAFNGAWIDTPDGIGQGTAGNPLGVASTSVEIPESGTWYLWVRMYGPDGNSNSWFESVGGSSREILSTDDQGVWVWVAGQAYSLDAGPAVVELAGRESAARADRLLLTNDPDFVPAEEPDADQTAPGAVTGLDAEAGGGDVQLSWTNPADGDLDRVVVRYRTDGVFPSAPTDGSGLLDRPAVPGVQDGYVHGGVQPGSSYHYSVFSVDAAGNVSDAAHVEAVVQDLPEPPQNVAVQ